MRKAAEILKSRTKDIAKLMTIESGKPIADAQIELGMGIDQIEWFAEEGRRAYGRIIPSRSKIVSQFVFKEPVGVVAAFTPWNWPVQQTARKIAPALAAGCSIIVKGPEETPTSTAEFVKAFDEAGIPKGTLNLVFGIPSEISKYLKKYFNLTKFRKSNFEKGVIPMHYISLNSQGRYNIGIRGGAVRPSSGYAFTFIQKSYIF